MISHDLIGKKKGKSERHIKSDQALFVKKKVCFIPHSSKHFNVKNEKTNIIKRKIL